MAETPLLVVGVDGAEHQAQLEWAAHEALRWGARLLLVHTWDGMIDPDSLGPPPKLRRRADETLQRAVEVVQAMGVSVESKLCEGFAGHALVENSREASLLIVGRKHRRLLSEAMHGSVSMHCARHATCPLALIPTSE